jgi:hypothetical protein
MSQFIKLTFLQRRYTDSQQAYGKMLNSASHWGNPNENRKTSPYICLGDYYKKTQKIKCVGEDVKKLLVVLSNGEQYGVSPKH